MYRCDRCSKQLSSKACLEYHLSNNVCQRGNRTCPECGRKFTNKRNLDRHISNQVCHNKTPKFALKMKTKPAYQEMSRDQLINEISEWKGKYISLKENPQTINSVNNVLVFPKAFGKEDIEHIQEKLGDFLRPLITTHPRNCITHLFKEIHSNEQLPEYHNIYSTSERSNYVMVSDGRTFKHCPRKTVIDQIIEDKRSIIDNYIEEPEGAPLGERVLKIYERYKNEMDNDTGVRKALEMEIGGLLLDMKSVIANDDKTRSLLDKVDKGEFELSNHDI